MLRMNCQQVETWLGEAACERDAAVGAEAQRHAAKCPRCAARLEAERLTTAALGALAAHDADASAPPRVESALLAAFRAQAVEPQFATEPATGAHAPRSRWSGLNRPRFALTALAFAAAVVLLVVAALRFKFMPAVDTKQTAGVQQNARPEAHASPTQTASASPAPRREDQVQQKSAPHKRLSVAGQRPYADTLQARRKQLIARGVREARPRALGTVGEMLVVAPREEAESVTEFVPLVASGTPPLASGQLVRVKLPRSALNALGLPLDLARAGESVQADVLVGDDGLARAIRLVRQRGDSF
jgi:hypothetical protein